MFVGVFLFFFNEKKKKRKWNICFLKNLFLQVLQLGVFVCCFFPLTFRYLASEFLFYHIILMETEVLMILVDVLLDSTVLFLYCFTV